MAIEKKSLISTLKTTKKANVASSIAAPEAAFRANKAPSKLVKSNKTLKKNNG